MSSAIEELIGSSLVGEEPCDLLAENSSPGTDGDFLGSHPRHTPISAPLRLVPIPK